MGSVWEDGNWLGEQESYDPLEDSAWRRPPQDYMEMVFGPGYFVSDTEVQETIGPEFAMYWNEALWKDCGRLGIPLRFP